MEIYFPLCREKVSVIDSVNCYLL